MLRVQGIRIKKHCCPWPLLYSHMVEPSGRGHRNGWGFRESPHHSAEVGREVGTSLVPGGWEVGRRGAGEVAPCRNPGLQSGGRAMDIKKNKRWVQPGSLQTPALGYP